MLPPGRRRGSALSPFAACLALLFLFVSTASAASSVLGLDFGTLNFKAVLVKPGIPFEIVLTKGSKRKESSAVAFKPALDSKKNIIAEVGSFPERAYGGDALALQARFPSEVFPNLKPLLGLSVGGGADEAIDLYKSRYPAVQATTDEKLGTTVVKSSAFADSEPSWSVEELLAMQLANVKENAEVMAGKGNVEDVVVTVPAFYTADERSAIQRAASLAGLEITGLISDGLAVGLDYAKTRTFPLISKGEKPEHHLVYDMGAGSTTATVLRFQGRSVKDVGRFNKTIQEVAVLGAGWDKTLGGDGLNSLVMSDYIEKFAAKSDIKNKGLGAADVRKNARAMSRLWKESEKARQVLSANTETSSSFEELLPDVDFRAKLSRSEFEGLAEGFADRVANPITEALAAAKLGMDDIDSIILHGGAIRTPFVQRKLEEIAGSSAKLRGNVNSDESAVFGAALKAASLSPSFKVKEIRDSDVGGYAMGMTYTDGKKDRRQVLFTPTSPVGNNGSTKQVTFKNKDDFAFTFFQEIGNVDHNINKVQTENLTASVKALEKLGCDKEEISTKFSIKLSPLDGLPTVVGGSVSCEVDPTLTESIGDSVKGWFGLGKKGSESGDDDEAGLVEEVDTKNATSTTESKSSTSSASGSASSSKAPAKPKKRLEIIPIAVTSSYAGGPQPSADELSRMTARLAAFDQSDRARFAREEALNVLEGFTYYVRDFLTNADYESFSTKAQRDDISKLLATTREFMEDPKEVSKATEEIFRTKLEDLKALVDPIRLRQKEGLVRPERVDNLKEGIEKMESLVSKVKRQIESASSKVASASESAASAASSAASEIVSEETESEAETATTTASSAETSVSNTDDTLDDLEDPESSSSSTSTSSSTTTKTTTTPPPRASTLRDFTAYTDYDLDRITEAWESATSWLKEQEAAQAKLSASEDPVLLVADVDKQADTLTNLMREMLLKAPQAQPPPKKPSTSSKSKTKKAGTSKTKKGAKGSSTATGSATSEAADEEATAAAAEVPEEERPEVVDDDAGSAEDESRIKDEL